MFSSAMEVDCCLEEFARVLVANGYINDDSCFNDADIPSMLNAFDTPTALDPTDSFPVSPCGYGDLSRAMEIAQMASQGLLDTCLTDNLTHVKPAPRELYHVKPHGSYVGHSIAGDPGPPMDASFQDSICSKDVFVHHVHDHQVNLGLSRVSRTQKDGMATNGNMEGSLHLLPHSLANPLEINSCQPDLLHHTIPGHDVFQSRHLQHQSSLYTEISLTASPGHGFAQVLSSKPKQKRKRRSKGYFKATKSKKRKTKEFADTTSQSKPKKQKVPKDNVQEQESVKRERSTPVDREDIPQEDSGFESADGKMGTHSGSMTVPSLEDASTTAPSLGDSNMAGPTLVDASSSENPECTDDSGPNTSLRRSSRTTRNPENYNFRLSSLVKRVETERRQKTPRQPKDKNKPPPLSKYRRRTANARERDRMKEINDAFDVLRASLPSIQRDDGKNKITKFTILKHTLNYIASLRDILDMEPVHSIHDDDTSSDLSSIRPGSVASSGPEDSCSSPTSGHSMTNQFSSQHVSLFSDTPFIHHQSPEVEVTTQGIRLPVSSAL